MVREPDYHWKPNARIAQEENIVKEPQIRTTREYVIQVISVGDEQQDRALAMTLYTSLNGLGLVLLEDIIVKQIRLIHGPVSLEVMPQMAK